MLVVCSIMCRVNEGGTVRTLRGMSGLEISPIMDTVSSSVSPQPPHHHHHSPHVTHRHKDIIMRTPTPGTAMQHSYVKSAYRVRK